MPTATSLPIPSSYYPVIERAKELPEIKEALSLNPEKAIPLLKRGTEIFQTMVGHGSGEEYRAICFLLARVKGLCGLHDSAVEILTELRSLNIRDDEYTDISFALSKALFNSGNFVHAIEVAEREFFFFTPEEDGYYSSTAILRCGSFRNLVCSSRLVLSLKDDNRNSVVEDSILLSFQDAVKSLNADILNATHEVYFTPKERAGLGIASAATVGNLAIAENCFENVRYEDINVKSWKVALSLLDSLPLSLDIKKDREESNDASLPVDCYYTDLINLLRARIHLNMAYTYMTMIQKSPDKGNEEIWLQRSFDSAGKALRVYEILVLRYPRLRTSLARVLGVLASCYKIGGSAVTAEGLFQSAIDKLDGDALKGSNPFSLVDKHGILLRSAILYEDWENREGDSLRFRSSASEVLSQLPEAWRSAPELVSGLW
eukprot:CAMPEP_0116060656 /NCGR_PEP_ID=MMETSP0322-20121206/6555_1 /TAXON_ID=163516 /ORGANISM="Leptocylindrus danicus var. apora, Strain B651" /LENGTH=431 /DNA_ID=CAMNT_0003545337 /DNA_START=214 /DNA_END=1507 /DNA_ORIENTATION=+